MILNKLIQFWRLLMEHKKVFEALKAIDNQHCVQLIPIHENNEHFAIRKSEVEIILTDMFMRLRKRGRPKKEQCEEALRAA